ncbi:hypothetical protein ACFY0G_17510 [Streptomyces sp. NPDC001552]|uniref:hypothetical protein n=1 Tax=Streptomyces sp. NPDC001552 TaxID=3364587 RepID=UPI003685EFF3
MTMGPITALMIDALLFLALAWVYSELPGRPRRWVNTLFLAGIGYFLIAQVCSLVAGWVAA